MMKKTMTAGLALLLMAAAAPAALAQDRGEGRRDGGGRQGAVREGGQRTFGPGQGQGQAEGQRTWNQGDRGQRNLGQADGGQRGRDDGDRGGRRRDGGGQRWNPGGEQAQVAPTPPAAQIAPTPRADRQQTDRFRGDRDGRGDGRDWNGRDGRGDRAGRDNDRRWDNDRRGDGSAFRNWRGDNQRGWRSPQRYRYAHAWRPPSGFYVRAWSFGDMLPRGWYGDDYTIVDYWNYGLPRPPLGYDWVRVGSDAILVDRFTGRVEDVVSLAFW